MKFLHLFPASLCLIPSATLQAQAVYTANRTPVQIGVGFTLASPDYGERFIKGVSFFGDLGLPRRFSLEGDIHYVSLLTPTDIGENTFLLGPRYTVLHQDRFNAYVKAMGGVGRFVYQLGYFQQPHTDTFAAFSFGAGMEYRAGRHINVRAIDIEAQKWPNYSPHTLSPFVVTFGVAYIP